ncbi:uncharacterized protein LOC118409408 [Branchiostoma floridae]|uniref:Uncharacterized protein LOC118409408 n=1 Tax=Branchiostoma floridae TaxID=7739 RepID=A0A9J7HXN5_BRAFL|nr:uncharacterized protein LOC118409408 [Branchiostoma floridae]
MEVAIHRWVTNPGAHASEIKEFLRTLPRLIKDDIKAIGNYCCALEIASGLTIGELLAHLCDTAMAVRRVRHTRVFCAATTNLLQRMWGMTPVSKETVMCFFQDVDFAAVVGEDRSAALLAECLDMAPDAGWQTMCQEIVDIRRQFMSTVIRNQFITSAVFSALSLWQCRQTTEELREVKDKLSSDYDRKLTNIKSRLDKADRDFRSILDKFEQEDQTDPIMLLDVNMLTSDLRNISHDLELLRNDVNKDRRDVCGRRNKHLIAMIPCAVGVAGAAANLPLAFAAGVTAGYKALAVAGVVLNGGALAGNAYCAKKCQDTISLIDDRLGAIAEYEDRVTKALERVHELQQDMEQHARQQERAHRRTTRRNAPWIIA